MRRLAHLSDLHFGREEPAVAEGLITDLLEVAPSLVVVSGDLTQRARRRQFQAARAFLDRLPFPWLAVPGNHDIPLYNLLARFSDPLGNWRRYFREEIEPLYRDDELLVVGISTARAGVWKSGRISLRQIEHVRAALCDAGKRFTVLAAHHPFTPLPAAPGEALLGRGLRALRVFEECGLQLILTGHLHLGHTGDVRDHYHLLDRSVLTAHATTSISNRRRGEPNAYNLLTLHTAPLRLTIEVRQWQGQRFAMAARTHFAHRRRRWLMEAGDPAWAPLHAGKVP
jgi:3',5'-cyclic AMP phosphodiesterase CpdA